MTALTRSFTKREKTLLLLLSILVLTAIYYFAVHLPCKTAIEEARSEKEALETENAVLQAKCAKKDQMQKELDEIFAGGEAKEVPRYDNIAAVTEYLNSALSQTNSFNVTCGDVKFDENAAIYRRPVQIRTNLFGYSGVQRVITKLFNCPYLSQISTIHITPYNRRGQVESNNIEDRDVTVSISMDFYEGRQK